MRGRVEVSFRLSDKAMDEGEWRSKWGLVPSGVVNGGGSGRGWEGGGGTQWSFEAIPPWSQWKKELSVVVFIRATEADERTVNRRY